MLRCYDDDMPSVSRQGSMNRKAPLSGERPKTVALGKFHYNARNLTGQRFGKLEVIEEYGRNHKRSLTWLCLCDCGNSVVRVGSSLLQTKSTSCGCNAQTVEARLRQSIAQRKEGSSHRKAFREYALAASARGHQFDLTLKDFLDYTSRPCFYCGDAPSQVKRSTFGFHVANGIDRVDNNLGYVVGNCVPCCMPCNYMKRAMSLDEFVSRCKQISEYERGTQNSISQPE